MPIQFGPLDDKDDRAAFSCGEPALDDWFRNRAGQDRRRRVAQIFVARDDQLGIVGFYSLSAFSIVASDLPTEITRKLPRYDTIPAVLIGRFAGDVRVRGQGIGELLMADAIDRIISTSDQLGIYAIFVDAKNADLAAYYQSFGFQALPSRPLRLFLPLATAHMAQVDASR
ncbi:MAG: GNAT family N-acetyltransferase [Steroidobacteraceae bacterium]